MLKMKIIEKLKNGWFVGFLIGIVIFIIGLILIFIFPFDAHSNSEINRPNWLSVLVAYLGFSSTIALGSLAFWQNERLNQINTRMLVAQEYLQTPIIDVDVFRLNERNIYGGEIKDMMIINLCNEKISKSYDFIIRNISEVFISMVKIESLIIEKSGTDEKVGKYKYNENFYCTNTYLSPKESKKLHLDIGLSIVPSYTAKFVFELIRPDGKAFKQNLSFQLDGFIETKRNIKTDINS
jgi:hypothetical protein